MNALKGALKGQYHAALQMLRDTIAACPEEVWVGGEHPRNPWRLAYHALYYTHLYLMPDLGAFVPWEKHREGVTDLWEDANPPVVEPYRREELLGYLDWIRQELDAWVDALDLESPESGFDWYRIPKLDHQLVNIRHLGIHLGQLQELVFRAGLDLRWVSIAARPSAG